MRISQHEREAIVKATQAADPEAELWLFGSRVDDAKRGGDIDIAIRSARIGLLERMRLRRAISDAIGEQKIDIVVSADGMDPFFRLARDKGVKIHG